MEENIIKNIDELNKALTEGYTNFSTKGLVHNSYYITFDEEGTYEVNDLADDLIICMDADEVNEWFEENFNNGTLIAED